MNSLVSDDSFSASIRSYDAGASNSSRGQGPRLIFTSEYIDLPTTKTPNSVANGEMMSTTLVSSTAGMPPRPTPTGSHLGATSTAFPFRNCNSSNSAISFSRGSSARVGASVSGSTTESLLLLWGGAMGSSAAAGSLSSRSSSVNDVAVRVPLPKGSRGHFSPSPRVVASTVVVGGASQIESIPPLAASTDSHTQKNFANFDVMDLGSVRMHTAHQPAQNDDLVAAPSLSLFSGAASDMVKIAQVAAMYDDGTGTQSVDEPPTSEEVPQEDTQCSKIVVNDICSGGEESTSVISAASLESLKAAVLTTTDDTVGQANHTSSTTGSESATHGDEEVGGQDERSTPPGDHGDRTMVQQQLPHPPTSSVPRPPLPLSGFSLPPRHNNDKSPLTNPLVVVQMPSSSSVSAGNDMSCNSSSVVTDALCAFSPHPPLPTGRSASDKVLASQHSLLNGSDLALRSCRPMTSGTSQTTNASSRGLSASQSGTMIPIGSTFSNFSTLPSQLSSVFDSSMEAAPCVFRTCEANLKGQADTSPSVDGNPLIAALQGVNVDGIQPDVSSSPSLNGMIAVFGHQSTSMLRAGYHQLVDDGSKCLADDSVRRAAVGTSTGTSILSSSAFQLKPFVSIDVSSSLSREQDDEQATRLSETVSPATAQRIITGTIARFCSKDRLRLRRESNAVDRSSARDDNHSSGSASAVNRSSASTPPDDDDTHPFLDERSDEASSCVAKKRRVSSIPCGKIQMVPSHGQTSGEVNVVAPNYSPVLSSPSQRAKRVIESVGGKGAFMEIMKSLYL